MSGARTILVRVLIILVLTPTGSSSHRELPDRQHVCGDRLLFDIYGNGSARPISGMFGIFVRDLRIEGGLIPFMGSVFVDDTSGDDWRITFDRRPVADLDRPIHEIRKRFGVV